MKSGIDDLLDHVDQWKAKLQKKLKRLSPAERKAFWTRIHEEARQEGLAVAGTESTAKRPAKRRRQTG
jgi:hypothetical protein